MSREAILKELELWPLWTLRQPLPEQAEPNAIVEASPAQTDKQQHSVAEFDSTTIEHDALNNEKDDVVDAITQYEDLSDLDATQTTFSDDAIVMAEPLEETHVPNMQFQLYESADGHCLMVHENAPFDESQSQLWHNILNAMRLNMTFVAENVNMSTLLVDRTPKVMLLFGTTVAQAILKETRAITALRQQKFHHQAIPCVVSFDLQHLLQNTQDKAKAWADLCAVLAILEHAQSA